MTVRETLPLVRDVRGWYDVDARTQEHIPMTPLRIFFASPGDVPDERKLALELLQQLPDEPFLNGKVTLKVVAWDKPGGGGAMEATLTPQEAIKRGLPKPSDCDLVIVILWSRLGTPLPEDWEKKPDGAIGGGCNECAARHPT